MKNKGFTLIELLAIVIILGLVGTMITISFSKSLSEAKQEKCDDFVKEIEDAACTYTSLVGGECIPLGTCSGGYSSCCNISLENIVEEGLLKSETDACTKSSLDLTKTITISWDSEGEKKCIYNGVRVVDEE